MKTALITCLVKILLILTTFMKLKRRESPPYAPFSNNVSDLIQCAVMQDRVRKSRGEEMMSSFLG